MLRTLRLISVIVAAAWATPAVAQTSPIMQHYRAYQAALEANDLATADREAAAALAASEARDGDGGRTAVLALNLASVRFLNNNAAGALEPGRRALALAQTRGEASGVSPVLAQLIVSRAELAAGQAAASENLTASLDRAVDARIESSELHDAAIQLGIWAFSSQRYDEAQRALAIATEYAEGSRFGELYGRATSRTWLAAALVLEERQGRNASSRINRQVANEAYVMLVESIVALRPLAEVNADGEVTRAQSAYAQALAWRAIIRAKMVSDGHGIPEMQEAQGDADGLSEVDVPPASVLQPRCLIDLTLRDGERLFPTEALMDGQLGGVAARFRIDEAGSIVDIQSLAVVGAEEFGESVVRHRRQWRAVRRDDSPPNCRMAMTVIQGISFQIG